MKEINRPKILYALHEYLPLIDEHNKQRQSMLNMERKWCTKDCWFRLLTTMTGMCVVDMNRWYRNVKAKRGGLDYSTYYSDEFEGDYEIAVRKFSDMLCARLSDIKRRQYQKRQMKNNWYEGIVDIEMKLERIKRDGSKTRPATAKQKAEGRKIGAACNSTCFICRKYLKPNGQTMHRQTTWCCSVCKMPLCKEDRTGNGRLLSCFDEHQQAEEECMMCEGHVEGMPFPDDLQIDINPKRNERRRTRK